MCIAVAICSLIIMLDGELLQELTPNHGLVDNTEVKVCVMSRPSRPQLGSACIDSISGNTSEMDDSFLSVIILAVSEGIEQSDSLTSWELEAFFTCSPEEAKCPVWLTETYFSS